MNYLKIEVFIVIDLGGVPTIEEVLAISRKCLFEKRRAYRLANKDKIILQKKKSREKHKAKILEYSANYRKDDIERIREISRNYYYAHRDEILKKYRLRYHENKRGVKE